MKQGHNDIARIYAQNAVRKQNEKLNLLQLASRVDAVAGRVQTAVTMRQITGNMMKVNRSLDVAMKSMSPERVRTSPKGGFTFSTDPALDRCRHGRLREAV
jgi:charged multivesicular body protein 1